MTCALAVITAAHVVAGVPTEALRAGTNSFFRFLYCLFLFYLVYLRFCRLFFVPSCKYYIDTNIQFFMSTLEDPEARNMLSRCTVLDGRAGA